MREQVINQFKQQYGAEPDYVIRAPGRVNLIGEHTDYNDGFVFPLAIDRAVWAAARPRADRQVHIRMLDFGTQHTFDLDALEKLDASPIEYVKGVAWALSQAGHALNGFDGVMAGDVPIGAGLSSSAALELATARTFAAVSGLAWEPKAMALLCQKAENQWVGVNSGIMDQMISATGQAGHAVLIDCRSLDLFPAKLPEGTLVVVLDTGTRRGLVGSAYNERRAQCEAAAQHFGVPKLRDVSVETFNARQHELDDVTMRRARHIVTENARTLEARDAMAAGDAQRLGVLMYGSHVSMRDDFEISTDALNAIVEIARSHDACYGARLTGAGFGGCGVALIRADAAESFVEYVEARYRQQTDHEPQLYVCRATDGAQIVE